MTASSRKLAALLGLTSGLLALAEGIAAQSFRCDDHLWRSGSSGRVVGGEAIALEDAPYQVVLAYRGRPFCGGTLIGPRHVLTAAHCVVDDGRPIPAGRLGVARTSHLSDAAFRSVARVHVHPGYSSDGGSPNDIAVLALDYALTRSAQAIARIATPRLDRLFAQPGNCARTTGFGSMRTQGSMSRTLRAAAVPVLSVEECRGSLRQDGHEDADLCGIPVGRARQLPRETAAAPSSCARGRSPICSLAWSVGDEGARSRTLPVSTPALPPMSTGSGR